MAVQRSQPPIPQWSLQELTVKEASGDLLDVEPIDLGPGSPGSAALAIDREANDLSSF
jgi:hypothetical protein